MNDSSKWSRDTCLLTGGRVDSSPTPYPRFRAVFAVSVDNRTNVAALVRLDAWGTQQQAVADQAHYPPGNRTACFCPTHDINVFFPETDWSIYRFCYFSLSEAEIASLLFYFRLWFYSGIVAMVVGPACMAVSVFIWIKSKCFKRPLPRGCCGIDGYAPINEI
jgi:hypothetical protein